MSYDDGGMCSAGLDFDAVWTEMKDVWQRHQVRLGYLRAALEGFVRLLHPDATEADLAVEAAELQLRSQGVVGLVHADAVSDHLRAHAEGVASPSTPVAAGVAQATALHEMAVRGRVAVPEPDSDADGKVFPAGYAEVCAVREASTVLLLGIQLLMAAAVRDGRVAVFDDKYLLDGMWIPDALGWQPLGGRRDALPGLPRGPAPSARRASRVLSRLLSETRRHGGRVGCPKPVASDPTDHGSSTRVRSCTRRSRIAPHPRRRHLVPGLRRGWLAGAGPRTS